MIAAVKRNFGCIATLVPISDNTPALILNTGVAFELQSGAASLEIRHIHIGYPGDAWPNKNRNYNLLIVVIDKSLPADVSDLQNIAMSPGFGGLNKDTLNLPYNILFMQNVGGANQNSVQRTRQFNFNDGQGPKVGRWAMLTVMLIPIFSSTVAAIPVDGKIFMQLNVYGSYNNQRGDNIGRSIPRGRI